MVVCLLSPLPHSVIWKKVTGPAHSQGEGIRQEVEIVESYLRVYALPGLAPDPEHPPQVLGPYLCIICDSPSISLPPSGLWGFGWRTDIPQACLFNFTVYRMLPFCTQKPDFEIARYFCCQKFQNSIFNSKAGNSLFCSLLLTLFLSNAVGPDCPNCCLRGRSWAKVNEWGSHHCALLRSTRVYWNKNRYNIWDLGSNSGSTTY